MEKKIIFLMALILVPTIFASELEVSLKPHYYAKGEEVIYTPDIEVSSVSFEVIGENFNDKNRILNLSIVNASPGAFEKALPKDIVNMLRISQKKTLWISQLIPIKELNETLNKTNFTFFVGVDGIDEKTGKDVYSEGRLNLTINKIEVKQPIFSEVGNIIWEGNPLAGILVLFGGLTFILFVFWKNKSAEKLERWRDKSERRKRVRRLYEEGY